MAACPAGCIRVEAGWAAWADEPDAETGSARAPHRFDLDLGHCLLCGLCAAACPEEAITLSGTPAAQVAAGPLGLVVDRDRLLWP